MIQAVVVGHGLAGRHFHAPLLCRQQRIRLRGLVVRDAERRAEALAAWPGTIGYAALEEALDDPVVDLVVLATPHDVHAEQVIRTLNAGKHCVVDKVMALTSADCERMIAARDASGRVLSVFHNRRWDWDYLTVQQVLASGRIGRPLLIESAVCRHSMPRTWRGELASAGTILFDWGAHLVDQALVMGLGPCRRLASWLLPAPWEGVDVGGHGRIVLEFDDLLFQVETSRVCRLDRPRWWVVATRGGLARNGIDPQEEALRRGDLDSAFEAEEAWTLLREEREGGVVESRLPSVRGSWDSYYHNIAAHVLDGASLEVTAEQGREVVRVLEAAGLSSREHRVVEGPWGKAGH